MKSFGYRKRKILRLDGWSGLDGNQVHYRVVQVYLHKREFWNLGRRNLAKPFLLRTSTSWKLTKVHRTRYALPLSSLDDRLLDN